MENYIREVNEGVNVEPPKIIIEAYFDAEMPSFLGDGNSEKNIAMSIKCFVRTR